MKIDRDPGPAISRFTNLGLTIESALALPVGSFAPHTNVPTYLVVVKKGQGARMFVAQLSSDTKAKSQILSNFREGKEGGTLDLGEFVDTQSFRGLMPSERLSGSKPRPESSARHQCSWATSRRQLIWAATGRTSNLVITTMRSCSSDSD